MTFLLKDLKSKWPSRNISKEYSPIPKTETGLDFSDDSGSKLNEELEWKQPPRDSRLCWVLELTILILFIALSTISILHFRLRSQMAPPKRLDCGTTLADAHERGCTFDQVAKHWMPSQCPRYGLDEYLAAASTVENSTTGQWSYYRDQNKTQEISMLDISHMAALPAEAEENMWWSTGSEHALHCTWALLRTAYAHHNGQRIDRVGSDFDHTKHCTFFLLDLALKAPHIDTMPANGNAAFGWC